MTTNQPPAPQTAFNATPVQWQAAIRFVTDEPVTDAQTARRVLNGVFSATGLNVEPDPLAESDTASEHGVWLVSVPEGVDWLLQSGTEVDVTNAAFGRVVIELP